ncbi:MAG: hypothetical protein HY787_28400 [Deltaproteobacteria bacterium]|jgi:hypothetical protein|nr:hypothetical protein [Deltaproteobacteria bacterium]
MPRSKPLEADMKQKINSQLKVLNKNLKTRLAEFQRTETIDLPKVLPAAEELQELKGLIDWCLRLWAEHDGFIFKPGPYFNE